MLLTGNWELILLLPALLLVVGIGNRKIGRDLFLGSLVVALIGWLTIKLGFGGPMANMSIDPYLKRPALIVILPAVAVTLVSIVITRRAGSEWKAATKCIIMFALGLGCFLYLPMVSMMNPPVNWGYPRMVDGFFHCITRGQYETLHPTDNWYRFCAQLCMVAKDTSNAFGWYYLPFALASFCFLHRVQPEARKWMFGLFVIFIYLGPLLIAMLNPSDDKVFMDLLRPYWSAMYVILAVWAGLGMMTLAAVTPPAWGRMESKAAVER